MSEYWVSQAKFYCKVCNCYIADNKPSRLHHENGVKHKEKVEQMLKQKRLDKLHGARSESELKHQLAEIEKAAKEALSADRAEQDGNFYQVSLLPPVGRVVSGDHFSSIQNSGIRPRAPPPPPAPRPPGFAPPRKTDDAGEDELEEEDGTGIYTVKGQTYLQGKIHEEKIRSGMPCEVFVEALDEWCAGAIDVRNETPVPYTTLVLVSFDVQYTITLPSGEAQVVTEKGIKSDRIRLLATAEGAAIGGEAGGADGTGDLPYGATVPVVLNENTGMGMWQTVSVREVDAEAEEAEAVEAALLREEMLSHARHKQDKEHEESGARRGGGGAGSAGRGAAEDLDDSAMSAYDPYGRHKSVYRGIRLHEDTDRKAQIESVAQGAVVSFKKRKTTTALGAAPAAAGSTDTQIGAATAERDAQAVVKTESKGDIAPVPEPPSLISSAESLTVAVAETPAVVTVEAAAPADGKVSMKISGGGSAKRKFRVRDLSP